MQPRTEAGINLKRRVVKVNGIAVLPVRIGCIRGFLNKGNNGHFGGAKWVYIGVQ